ncbi:hypothetical protein VOA_000719 [Vibrio sp. RC586]|nr:hypothetical protein VOA_000719 [Vibrio sp. RC586]
MFHWAKVDQIREIGSIHRVNKIMFNKILFGYLSNRIFTR